MKQRNLCASQQPQCLVQEVPCKTGKRWKEGRFGGELGQEQSAWLQSCHQLSHLRIWSNSISSGHIALPLTISSDSLHHSPLSTSALQINNTSQFSSSHYHFWSKIPYHVMGSPMLEPTKIIFCSNFWYQTSHCCLLEFRMIQKLQGKWRLHQSFLSSNLMWNPF
jgi:hypothetical protein